MKTFELIHIEHVYSSYLIQAETEEEATEVFSSGYCPDVNYTNIIHGEIESRKEIVR